MFVSERQTERRGDAGLSLVVNKATMGDRLGTSSKTETGLYAFVHRGSLRRGWREGRINRGGKKSAFWVRKVCRSERMCLGGVRYICMCVCEEPERHKQTV